MLDGNCIEVKCKREEVGERSVLLIIWASQNFCSSLFSKTEMTPLSELIEKYRNI
jgi:hypothetical protein